MKTAKHYREHDWVPIKTPAGAKYGIRCRICRRSRYEGELLCTILSIPQLMAAEAICPGTPPHLPPGTHPPNYLPAALWLGE